MRVARDPLLGVYPILAPFLLGERLTPVRIAAAILGSSLAFIDGTVVNVALPALQRELNASAFEAQWVIESYALLLAALVMACARVLVPALFPIGTNSTS